MVLQVPHVHKHNKAHIGPILSTHCFFICSFVAIYIGCTPEHDGPATWLQLLSNNLLFCSPKNLFYTLNNILRFIASVCTIMFTGYNFRRWRNRKQVQYLFFLIEVDDCGMCSGWLTTRLNQSKKVRRPIDHQAAYIWHSGNTPLLFGNRQGNGVGAEISSSTSLRNTKGSTALREGKKKVAFYLRHPPCRSSKHVQWHQHWATQMLAQLRLAEHGCQNCRSNKIHQRQVSQHYNTIQVLAKAVKDLWCCQQSSIIQNFFHI